MSSTQIPQENLNLTETSPQYESIMGSTQASNAKQPFNMFAKKHEDTTSNDGYNNDGEDQNGEKKKKKKKNKNKNKKNRVAGQEEDDQQQNSNPQANNQKNGSGKANGQQQNNDSSVFDKTSSTFGYPDNSAGPFSDRTLKEEGTKGERDFTPLKDKLGASFFEDQDSSEDEGMPDYKIGGYHPVHVGEILLDRYVIIQKLGWGHFSTVWLTKDLKFNNYVAMKVQKSAQHYLEAAYDEVEILDQVANNWKTEEWKSSIDKFYQNDPQLKAYLGKWGMSGDTSHCVQLLNSFIHHGPNGKHFVMVFEILGVNFLEIIKRYDYKGVPIPLVRKLARQCLVGLDYLHRMCKIIHTDFKPENVVICLRDDEVKEIANTGQLTTTKMFQNKSADIIKKINMKIAGTLPTQTAPAPVQQQQTAPVKQESNQDAEETPAVSQSRLDGLTAKQRKNQKKKLQKKKKKNQIKNADEESKVDEEEQKKEEITPAVMAEISNQVLNQQDQTQATKKRHVKKGSMDLGGNDRISGLLLDEDDKNNQQQLDGEPKKRRGPKIDENVMVKICDMGNGCWTYHHFTPEIQTRQYRSPEVIIGSDYNTSADVWSFACTIFEMVTGDFLFEPRKGNNYDKDDDHLAQMMELLGRMPKNMALSGKNSKKFFNSQGHLKRISGLNYWPLKKVLMEKYRIKEEEAQSLSDFLVPMLEWYPEKRATAQKMLDHPWLNMASNYEYKYTDREYEVMMLKKELKDKVKGGNKGAAQALNESHEEMNELIESDEENNAADIDEFTNFINGYKSSIDDDDDFEDKLSLMDSDEERSVFRRRKEREAKINNSFTGPYPIDPTDFNHTDKGPNNQFAHNTKNNA